MIKQIPNFFTLLNLVFGCLAIRSVFSVDTIFLHSPGLSWGLLLACFYVCLSALVDFLDGFVARLFRATSAMGEQLDSLADAVSFGVAPGMIIWRLLEVAFTDTANTSVWAFLPALLVPCAAVWRLAKFNLDKEQRYYFKGIPTPAMALVVASFPVIIYDTNDQFAKLLQQPGILYAVIIVLSLLMVCNVPFISLKFKSYSVKGNLDKIILIILAILSALFFKWLAVPVVFIGYVIVSLIFKPNKN